MPPEAWDYKLGNRSALEWILDQYKEKKSKDPTIREKFDTYRFADYKEKVINLLMRVTRVSVETQAIVEAMKAAARRRSAKHTKQSAAHLSRSLWKRVFRQGIIAKSKLKREHLHEI